MAIQILMVDGFSIPEDLYFWRQNRLGSVLPLLAWPFFKLGLSALLAVSMAQTLIFTGVFVMLYKLLNKSWFYLAIPPFILFPIYIYIDTLYSGHPYIGHLFFLILLVFLVKHEWKTSWKKWLSITLTVGLMYWASEISLANFLVLPLLVGLNFKKITLNKSALAGGAIGLLASFFFIVIAKSEAYRIQTFSTLFATPAEALDTITMYFNNWKDHLDTWEMQVWSLGILAMAALLAFQPNRFKLFEISLSQFFLFSSLITVAMVMVSHWAVFMGRPFRYLCPAYVQLLLAFVFWLKDKPKFHWGYLLPIIMIISSSTYSYTKQYNLKGSGVGDWLSRDQAKEFAAENKNIGVIGIYWNSYIIEAFDTRNIDATAHDKDLFRGERSLRTIFERDSILFIRNGVIDRLPDTLYQFGATLVKSSTDRQKDNFDFAYYHVVETRVQTFTPKVLNVSWGGEKEGLIYFGKDNRPDYPWVITGPNSTLQPGKYKVCINYKYLDNGIAGGSPEVIISHSFSKHTLVKEQLHLTNEISSQCVELNLTEAITTFECKVFYYYSGELYFKNITIEKL